MEDLIVDCDRPSDRVRLMQTVQSLRGRQRVSITRFRPRRSDRQNRYYWPCFIHAFAQFQRDQGEGITDEEAHEFFKMKFLRRPVMNPITGEVVGQTVRSTTELTTAEFNLYLDQCAAWLFNAIGIVVPNPSDYHEKEEEKDCKNSRGSQ